MEENGNMMDLYVEYTEASEGLLGRLGIKKSHWYVQPELQEPLTYILKYLNSELILSGYEEVGDLIRVIMDIAEYGARTIIRGEAEKLFLEVTKSLVDDDIYLDRFIFCWSNVLTSLTTQIELQYASLLYPAPAQGCPCCCGKGETQADWESYRSGVWPEDEEYKDDYSTTIAGSTLPCGCAGR